MAILKRNTRKSYQPEKKAHAGRKADNSFYHTKRWRTLRNYFILTNPFCVHCKKNGILRLATVVDHIHPVSKGGKEYDESNLQALCDSCHNRKSGKERHT